MSELIVALAIVYVMWRIVTEPGKRRDAAREEAEYWAKRARGYVFGTPEYRPRS